MTKSEFPIKFNNKGQGLIEVLVSIALIITGILGALTLATYSIRAGTESRERVQAALLAQEGIEIVKNIRDTNWIAGNNWDANLPPVDKPVEVPSYMSNVGYLNGPAATSGPLSNFTRTTTISNTTSPDKKQITCTVSWTDASGKHTVTAIDYITNWQKTNK